MNITCVYAYQWRRTLIVVSIHGAIWKRPVSWKCSHFATYWELRFQNVHPISRCSAFSTFSNGIRGRSRGEDAVSTSSGKSGVMHHSWSLFINDSFLFDEKLLHRLQCCPWISSNCRVFQNIRRSEDILKEVQKTKRWQKGTHSFFLQRTIRNFLSLLTARLFFSWASVSHRGQK